MKTYENKYSFLEKSLHHLAFNSRSILISLSNFESYLFKKELAGIEGKKPVFISALPRAGTTLLLELCIGTNQFVSHTYGDMPFLLTPLFWNRFSKVFRQSGTSFERVHGDGIMVNVDSPEAFEEIIWKGFWPSRYKKDRIIPWSEPSYPEFEKFIHEHLRKIIFMRADTEIPQVRYISKNNLNIARIGYLKSIYPDSRIIVPFRSPLQHASSLLRQHRNFLTIHKQDLFARKYMEDTGHFDFGNNLRPVNFDNWLLNEGDFDPNTLLFWLKYWICTYQYLLTNANTHVKFFSYDLLCNDPRRNLEQLGKYLEIKDIESFKMNADRIIAPKLYQVDSSSIPSDILGEADNLFLALQALSQDDSL